MSKRKISSYFQHETDKIINKAEGKSENEFTRRKMLPICPFAKATEGQIVS